MVNSISRASGNGFFFIYATGFYYRGYSHVPRC
jgi:hypothetical protein